MSTMTNAAMTEEDGSCDLFQRIQNYPGICNNCFRETHNIEEVNYIVQSDGYAKPLRKSLEPIVKPNWDPRPHTQFHAYDGTNGRRSTCPCGSVRNSTKMRPVDKSTLMQMAHRLLDRIKERTTTDVNEDAYYETIRTLKSDSDEQFKDDQILDRAVRNSIQ